MVLTSQYIHKGFTVVWAFIGEPPCTTEPVICLSGQYRCTSIHIAADEFICHGSEISCTSNPVDFTRYVSFSL